ncbi:hypothetical protein BT96DRAFT_918708 [Gymnopus androsaceus JB14]|uniref:Conidiation protein 6 n=1 Tax=Gymnopus androsaceus JB14 TaxID=1447944 RepID=A0A6A4HV21_9AGAR|nr:hypothetical protein BT96DRAFT_918708 [Gymnopus androsaceus JB14]
MSSNQSQKDPNRVAAGLKATIHNDNISEETKDRAAERLHEMGVEVDGKTRPSGRSDVSYTDEDADVDDYETGVDDYDAGAKIDTKASPAGGSDDAHTNRVLGGYKATLKNDNVSDEAKAHAREVLEANDAMPQTQTTRNRDH